MQQPKGTCKNRLVHFECNS